MDAKKKPSLALVIAEKGKSDDDAPDSADGDDEYEAARDELADVLDVPDAKREAFGDALRAFVVTCK